MTQNGVTQNARAPEGTGYGEYVHPNISEYTTIWDKPCI
jgi:hypothetical protein